MDDRVVQVEFLRTLEGDAGSGLLLHRILPVLIRLLRLVAVQVFRQRRVYRLEHGLAVRILADLLIPYLGYGDQIVVGPVRHEVVQREFRLVLHGCGDAAGCHRAYIPEG